ncbi:MAG: PrsW family intramembrane metalloprotease [Chloroflexia bacterium]|nr:PrsW family intramembrane metalloprotease [Chloroflexia bacterium]
MPAHALFGITMGYYFGLARFNENKKTLYIWLAILIPILLHGFYDFCLMSGERIIDVSISCFCGIYVDRWF